MRTILSLSVCLLLLQGCKPDPQPQPSLPDLSIRNSSMTESAGNSFMEFEVVATGSVEQPIQFSYQVQGITAEPEVDYSPEQGTLEIAMGTTTGIIAVEILADELNEVDEKLAVRISNVSNANLKDTVAIGIIRDDDDPILSEQDSSGYQTSETHYGYEIAWADEFDGEEPDPTIYNYNLGDGCPSLCGWGNAEQQWYTDDSLNIHLADGKMIITATEQTAGTFQSARVNTQENVEFTFGRIDIRAKLPRGQGIRPVFWMLGSDIDAVGWPACGEINIMDLAGHEPNTIYGTAHWGDIGQTFSNNSTSTYTISEAFSEQFHVFTLIWEQDEIVWYLDETKFKTLTPADLQGERYPFNQPFFFLFNIAVGGAWPGSPDNTTVFPQSMEIDYVRVFQIQ